jgi:hypothetical protein
MLLLLEWFVAKAPTDLMCTTNLGRIEDSHS